MNDAHRKLSGRVVIATHNPGKLREMRELLAPYGIEAVSAGDLGLIEPDETGLTFLANAELKARAAAQVSGLPSFADDSGLCVDALGGDPGIYSARWAKEAGDFAAAMAHVHALMQAKGAPTPRAHLRSPSSGPTGIWSNSRAKSLATSSGRRAGRRASAMIPSSSPTTIPARLGKCRRTKSTAFQPTARRRFRIAPAHFRICRRPVLSKACLE